MEFVGGGELYNRLFQQEQLSEPETRFVLGSVALMLEHIHARDYVYRDLKPENVMVGTDGYLKLVDFGFCKRLPAAEQTFTACGTVEYMAPEIVQVKGHGHEVDWWAAGVLLYECLHGYTPFTDEGTTDSEMVPDRPTRASRAQQARSSPRGRARPQVIIKNIKNADYQIPLDSTVSPAACSLVASLLCRSPSARITARRLQRHPFFSGFDFRALVRKQLQPPHVRAAALPPPLRRPRPRPHRASAVARVAAARRLRELRRRQLRCGGRRRWRGAALCARAAVHRD
jgi:serine/threonine protein kinase